MPKGEENLIPLNKRTKEEVREIASKGGSVSSPKKKLAARLRRLREKGMTDEAAQRITEIFEDSEMSALDIFLYFSGIKMMSTLWTGSR